MKHGDQSLSFYFFKSNMSHFFLAKHHPSYQNYVVAKNFFIYTFLFKNKIKAISLQLKTNYLINFK